MSETTARALRLLDLLQSRPVWSGSELASRLGVTTRSIRRDVERLRDLGYPVEAERGSAGGYRLGAGRQLPPLLLDDDEAIAIAVCLRLAAGGSVSGIGEAAVRTLAKLDQVLPARLRAQVEAIHAATLTLDPGSTPLVDAAHLLALARAVRATTVVRFRYVSSNGTVTERRVEPYRLVATGRRWYLFAWDTDRSDWRTFRLDRITEIESTTWRFRARETPDIAERVTQALAGGSRHVVRARLGAPKDVVAQRVPSSVGTLRAAGPEACVLTATVDWLDQAVHHLGAMPWPVTVLEPPELRTLMREQGERLLRAAADA